MGKVTKTMEDYKDIINLPRHISKTRSQMTVANRSAQFAPFSAVVGHDAAIKETARYTDRKKELDEMEKAIVDQKLMEINAWLPELREIEIIHFVQDKNKVGGSYVSKFGCVKKIDSYKQEVIFTDGVRIKVEEIYSIDLQPGNA